MIDRGTCDFVVKVKNVQNAGAIGRHRRQQRRRAAVHDGRHRHGVTIPSVMVSLGDGRAIKAAAGTNATVRLSNPAPLQRDGSARLRHRLARVRPWPDVADDRQHERRDGRRHRRGHGRRAGGPRQRRRPRRRVLGVRSGGHSLGAVHGLYDARTRRLHRRPRCTLDGEIYGAIGWRLRENFRRARSTELLEYLVDGMNYTPATPKFEQMRDGILQAVAASPTPGDECLVWDAFARFRRRRWRQGHAVQTWNMDDHRVVA